MTVWLGRKISPYEFSLSQNLIYLLCMPCPKNKEWRSTQFLAGTFFFIFGSYFALTSKLWTSIASVVLLICNEPGKVIQSLRQITKILQLLLDPHSDSFHYDKFFNSVDLSHSLKRFLQPQVSSKQLATSLQNQYLHSHRIYWTTIGSGIKVQNELDPNVPDNPVKTGHKKHQILDGQERWRLPFPQNLSMRDHEPGCLTGAWGLGGMVVLARRWVAFP